jgi:uncharacterized NAD(P)/FAD-binding protein YdhS
VSRLYGPETGARFERNARGELEFLPGPNTRKVTLCSRNGRFPKPRPDNFKPIELTYFTKEKVDALFKAGKLDLPALASLADKEIKKAGVSIDWERLVDPHRGLTQDQINRNLMAELETSVPAARGQTAETSDIFLYRLMVTGFAILLDLFENQKLSPEDQLKARRQLEAIFLQYAAACPPETAEMTLALMKSGHLELLTGVSAFEADDQAGVIRIAHEDPARNSGTHTTTTVINATGMPDRDPTLNKDPLIQSLLEQDVLAPYRREGQLMGGIDIDPKTLHPIGADGRPSPCLYVLGELLKGRQFLVNATFLLNELTVRVAQSIRDDAAVVEQPKKKLRKFI